MSRNILYSYLAYFLIIIIIFIDSYDLAISSARIAKHSLGEDLMLLVFWNDCKIMNLFRVGCHLLLFDI